MAGCPQDIPGIESDKPDLVPPDLNDIPNAAEMPDDGNNDDKASPNPPIDIDGPVTMQPHVIEEPPPLEPPPEELPPDLADEMLPDDDIPLQR